MSRKTRKITLAALFSAFSVVILYIASVWPTGQLGLVAVSSVFVAAAVVEGGVTSGVSVFAVSSALGMLIVPNRVPPVLFIIFFGYYPVVKCIIERVRNVIMQWFLKLAIFNAALLVIWYFLSELFMSYTESIPGTWLVYLLGSVVFVVYDYGFSKVIWLYITRVSKHTTSP